MLHSDKPPTRIDTIVLAVMWLSGNETILISLSASSFYDGMEDVGVETQSQANVLLQYPNTPLAGRTCINNMNFRN